MQLRVAGQLGDQAVDREGRPVELEEALLEGEAPSLLPQVGQHRVGEERPPSPAASAREGMGDLVAPGERPELIAPLARRPKEADAGVVDGEGVGAQLAGGLARLKRPRVASRAWASCAIRIPSSVANQSRWPEFGGRREGDELSPVQPTEHLLRPASVIVGQVDHPDLLGREHAVLGQGGDDLDRRFRQAAGGLAIVLFSFAPPPSQ